MIQMIKLNIDLHLWMKFFQTFSMTQYNNTWYKSSKELYNRCQYFTYVTKTSERILKCKVWAKINESRYHHTQSRNQTTRFSLEVKWENMVGSIDLWPLHWHYHNKNFLCKFSRLLLQVFFNDFFTVNSWFLNELYIVPSKWNRC